MEEYVIEKNVPLPDMTGKKHVSQRGPDSLWSVFIRMEAGDSILTKRTLQAISSAAIRSKTHVTSRREGDRYRVWKVEKAL
jgi:hypothetical protein